jgi:hypothetical protein
MIAQSLIPVNQRSLFDHARYRTARWRSDRRRGHVQASDGVVSCIGIAGNWAGTGSLSCSAAMDCRVCAAMLMAPARSQQNEAACVVYGMPREAVAPGAAAQVLPLTAIAEAMLAARGRREPGSDRPSPDASQNQGRPAIAANHSAANQS